MLSWVDVMTHDCIRWFRSKVTSVVHPAQCSFHPSPIFPSALSFLFPTHAHTSGHAILYASTHACAHTHSHVHSHKQVHLLLLFPVVCDKTDTLSHLISVKPLCDIFSGDGGFRVGGWWMQNMSKSRWKEGGRRDASDLRGLELFSNEEGNLWEGTCSV